jgi:hypothetical protein
MADYPGYAERAVQAEEHAERASSPSLADSWRKVASRYWALDRQLTEMKYQRELRRTPNIKNRNI